MGRAGRILMTVWAAVLAFAVVLLFLVPSGCNDGGGVSSWDRCITYMGTPAFSVEDWGWDATLNVIPPLLAGIVVGIGTWLWLERRSGHRLPSPPQ